MEGLPGPTYVPIYSFCTYMQLSIMKCIIYINISTTNDNDNDSNDKNNDNNCNGGNSLVSFLITKHRIQIFQEII